MDMIIKNGRVVDPSQDPPMDHVANVLVKDGKVVDIQSSGQPLPEAKDLIDAQGCIVAPGLIDMHVHFRDPGQTHKEDLISGTKAAVAGGYTSTLCMPNTSPSIDTPETVSYILEKSKREGYCHVYPVGAITKGLLGREITDMDALHRAGCIVFSDDGRPCVDTALFRRAMEKAASLGALIIEHCEDIHLTAGKTTIHEGDVSKKMGLNGIASSSETVDVARSMLLAAETGARLHLAHMSCAESIDMIVKMKERLASLTCEVSPHHLTLTVDEVERKGTKAKMYPPLRTRQDIERLQQSLSKGYIDVIATDHAPHSVLEKNVEFSLAPNGVIGLQTALYVMLTLVEKKVITLSQLISTMSTNAAKILGIDAGSLKKGMPADIVVFSLDGKHDLGKLKNYSKSSNSPFEGFMGTGRVLHTLVRGKRMYDMENA